MVFRIYVEKRPGLQHQAQGILREAHELYHMTGLEKVRYVKRYDAGQLSKQLFDQAIPTVFSEPMVDRTFLTLEETKAAEKTPPDFILAVEALPGQFDQRADSCEQCIQMLSQGERPQVRAANLYLFYGKLSEKEKNQLRKLLINPVDSRETDLGPVDTLALPARDPEEIPILEGFRDFDEKGLVRFLDQYALAMDLADLSLIQKYFQSLDRDPSMTEIRILDTYWSDHCRHTTFATIIDDVRFEDPLLEKTYQDYIKTREMIGDKKPICLMDLGTIGARALRAAGKLDGLDQSEEINACTVKIKVRVDGEEEPWLLLFKNETHNHPTEIEPFGGAATCIGGAIRDPLSGRAYVYGAMRLTGAANPLTPVEETLPGKLPQYQIVREAARGYSSYGNQIGLATGGVHEIYHPGYAAKRMEVGAVIGAVPERLVRRETPAPGDLVLLLGGRTGRDGIGGATGSSKSQNVKSVETAGAEVQKGNAPEERKLQRFFRNPEAVHMIKRSNDFGAGGVSVAIGELADGLKIDLDRVPKKYDGLDGTELAISESQERMAVVIEPKDFDRFMEIAKEENLEATKVAEVTEKPSLLMTWRGKTIVDLDRSFLDQNGAEKHISVQTGKGVLEKEGLVKEPKHFSSAMDQLVTDLNGCSQRGLVETFDSTIGAGTVLMPYGGKKQLTPNDCMVQKISLEKGDTDTVSFMAWGFNPFVSSKSPYHGAYLAVVESVAKLIAAGANLDQTYLSFQEYFPKTGTDPQKWGLPLAALLGAYQAQKDLGLAAIGGKDSMSGTFEQLDVPPTLISFAVTTGSVDHVLSSEFKGPDHPVQALLPLVDENGLPLPQSLRAIEKAVFEGAKKGEIYAASAMGMGGIGQKIYEMALGNELGFSYQPIDLDQLFSLAYGGLVLELAKPLAESEEYTCLNLGKTLDEPVLIYKEERVPIADLLQKSQEKLEGVFPLTAKTNHEKVCDFKAPDNTGLCPNRTARSKSKGSMKNLDFPTAIGSFRPQVLIPVFPGTNTEYDSARYVERAGLKAKIFVINNQDGASIAQSLDFFRKDLDQSQVLYIPGGFSGGDEPDGAGKFITAFMRNEGVSAGIKSLLEGRGGLILGICNGFQALIKLGLVPYGKIVEPSSDQPTLTYNTIGRHQSRMVRLRLASVQSPWLQALDPKTIYTAPISHGEGRLIADPGLINDLFQKEQVATQYVDFAGNPSMDIFHNPNGSIAAIEGLLSPDGHVFGKMGHAERVGRELYQNVPGIYDMKLFESAKKYFEEK